MKRILLIFILSWAGFAGLTDTGFCLKQHRWLSEEELIVTRGKDSEIDFKDFDKYKNCRLDEPLLLSEADKFINLLFGIKIYGSECVYSRSEGSKKKFDKNHPFRQDLISVDACGRLRETSGQTLGEEAYNFELKLNKQFWHGVKKD